MWLYRAPRENSKPPILTARSLLMIMHTDNIFMHTDINKHSFQRYGFIWDNYAVSISTSG